MDLYGRALARFGRLLRAARRTRLREPAAVSLATSGRAGRVSCRTVLLRGWDRRGLVFYTNLSSRKGRQIRLNPRACLCFYWDPLGRQVTIEGRVRVVSEGEADAYWRTRPRLAQLGAWASRQSARLDDRHALVRRLQRFRRRFRGRPVPRPRHWSGFRLEPDRIEFWRARPHRLHERTLFERRGGRWKLSMLYP